MKVPMSVDFYNNNNNNNSKLYSVQDIVASCWYN